MQRSHVPTRPDRRPAARAVPLLWVLASLCLLQWGLSVGPIGGPDREATARHGGNSLGSSPAKLRDLAKLGGTDMRAKDGKQQAAPSGGDPALAAGNAPVILIYAGTSTLLAAASTAQTGIAGLSFQARAPPRAVA